MYPSQALFLLTRQSTGHPIKCATLDLPAQQETSSCSNALDAQGLRVESGQLYGITLLSVAPEYGLCFVENAIFSMTFDIGKPQMYLKNIGFKVMGELELSLSMFPHSSFHQIVHSCYYCANFSQLVLNVIHQPSIPANQ